MGFEQDIPVILPKSLLDSSQTLGKSGIKVIKPLRTVVYRC